LRIFGSLKKEGFKKIIIRFPRPLKIKIARKIVLSVKGQGRGELLYLLTKNVQGKYFLIKAGHLNYKGWKKYYINIPKWIVQKSKNMAEKTGMSLIEMLIIPAKKHYIKKTDIGFDNLAVIEDEGLFYFSGMEMINLW